MLRSRVLLRRSNSMGKYGVAPESVRRMMRCGTIGVDRMANKRDMHMQISNKHFGKFGAIATVIAGVLLSSSALADDTPSLLTDSFQVALGTFILTTEPVIQLKGDTSNGDKVDFDEALGGGDSQRIRLDSFWRFGDSQRHKVKAIAFDMSNDHSKTWDRDIEWGGDIYPVGAKIDAEFSFTVIEVAYEYAFLKRDNYELDGSIGLHYTELSAALRAKAESSAGQLEGDISNRASVAAPLPVIGLRGIWDLSHNFWLDATAQFFALSIDEYDGNLQDYRVLVTWQPKKWLGVGLGYNRFTLDVDVDKSNFNGSLDWTYSGPMIFYSASF